MHALGKTPGRNKHTGGCLSAERLLRRLSRAHGCRLRLWTVSSCSTGFAPANSATILPDLFR